jgi:hypothetical protein
MEIPCLLEDSTLEEQVLELNLITHFDDLEKTNCSSHLNLSVIYMFMPPLTLPPENLPQVESILFAPIRIRNPQKDQEFLPLTTSRSLPHDDLVQKVHRLMLAYFCNLSPVGSIHPLVLVNTLPQQFFDCGFFIGFALAPFDDEVGCDVGTDDEESDPAKP